MDSNTSNPGGGTQAIIMGLHCSLGHGMIVAPTLRMTTPENEKSENSVVVNFEFKFLFTTDSRTQSCAWGYGALIYLMVLGRKKYRTAPSTQAKRPFFQPISGESTPPS